jgi:hypothetical protein
MKNSLITALARAEITRVERVSGKNLRSAQRSSGMRFLSVTADAAVN